MATDTICRLKERQISRYLSKASGHVYVHSCISSGSHRLYIYRTLHRPLHAVALMTSRHIFVSAQSLVRALWKQLLVVHMMKSRYRHRHPGSITPIIILSRLNAAKLPAGWSDWQLCSMYSGCRKSHMFSGCREKLWGAALFLVGTVNGYFTMAEFWVSGRGIRSSSAPCPGGCGTRMRP